MSRYGGGGSHRGGEREREREHSRRRSVDVQFAERTERDTYGTRERDFHFDENFETFDTRDARTSGALVPIHQERIIERDIVTAPAPQERFVEIERIEREPVIEVEVEKKITEHEHETHLHHVVIDHGTTYINAAPPPPPPPPPPKPRQEIRERETTRVTLEGVRERRYGTEYRGSGNLSIERDYVPEVPRPREPERERRGERETTRTFRYEKYKNGYAVDDQEAFEYTSPRRSSGMLSGASPRSSTGMLGNFQNVTDWTVVDVPPGTRRGVDAEVSWKTNSVRRNRGGFGRDRERKELWTEITKDLVAREALDEFGFYYEEVDDFFYVFEFLHKDQITDLVDLSKDIRREKVRGLEQSRERGRAPPVFEHDRISERRDFTPYGERDRFRESRDIYYS